MIKLTALEIQVKRGIHTMPPKSLKTKNFPEHISLSMILKVTQSAQEAESFHWLQILKCKLFTIKKKTALTVFNTTNLTLTMINLQVSFWQIKKLQFFRHILNPAELIMLA